MKKMILVMVVFLIVVFAGSCVEEKSMDVNEVVDAGEWRLGLQAYTFRKFTFYKTIVNAQKMGLNYIEAYPGQRLGVEHKGVKFGTDLSAELRAEVKQKLQDANVKLVNFGVVKLPNDEAQCRKVFDFAKDMGIETIVSEPPLDAMKLVDKLCNEYNIKVAIHNHPKPSRYWSPEAVLKACKGRSKMIGACVDTGHWARSGVVPAEAVKKLKGRIISLHLKDVDKFNVNKTNMKEGDKKSVDVVWGKGVAGIEDVLAELYRQGFSGVFSIEYESQPSSPALYVQMCIDYYYATEAKVISN